MMKDDSDSFLMDYVLNLLSLSLLLLILFKLSGYVYVLNLECSLWAHILSAWSSACGTILKTGELLEQ